MCCVYIKGLSIQMIKAMCEMMSKGSKETLTVLIVIDVIHWTTLPPNIMYNS